MNKNLDFKLVLSADNKQLISNVRESSDEVKRFGSTTRSASTEASDAINDVQTSTNQLNASMRSVAKAAAGGYLAFKVGEQVGDLAEKAAAYQDMRTRLTELSGSAQAYADNEAYLIQLADDHHKNLLTLANSYSRILTLEKAGLTTRAQARQILESLSNASSALGASNAQLEQSLYGIAQGMSAGTLRAEELNQVTEPLPGLLQELDEAAGVASGGFRRMVNDGQVTSTMFRDYLITALDSYSGAAARTANNINAKWADLENARIKLAVAFEEPISDSLSAVLDGTTSAIDFMAENADELITTLELLTVVLGARVVTAMVAATQAKMANVAAAKAQAAADLQAAVAAEKLAKANLLASQAAVQKARNIKAATIASVSASRNLEAANIRLSRAEARHATTLTTVASASQKATVASRALAGGMALLGGPLGLFITAASALAVFAINTSESSEKAGVLDGEIAKLANSYRDLNAAQLELKLVDLDEDIAKLKAIQEGQIAGLNAYQAQVNSGAAIFQSAVDDQTQIVTDSNAELEAVIQLRKDILARINELKNPETNDSSSTSGTSNADSSKELAELEASLYSQEQKIAEAYLRRQAILDTALENEQITKDRYDALSQQNAVKNAEDLVKLANQKRQAALTQQRAQELAEAQGFQSVAEQQEAQHQAKLAQIKQQKTTDALKTQRESELLAARGFNSREEYDAAVHQQRLAQIKAGIAINAVRARRERELLETAGYHSRAEAEEAAHQQRLVDIQKAKEDEVMQQRYQSASMTADIFGNLAQIAAEGGKKDFENSKRLAIVQATINGAVAATKAYEQGGILGPVLAATIAGLTAVQIAKINAQEYQGIAHGGMTNVPTESTYLLQKGERVLSPNQNQDFTRYIQQQKESANDNSKSNQSSTNVVQITFQIETNDAASFQGNLVRSKNTIESIVRQAMAANGGRL